MSRKNHEMIDGKLLQTDKKYAQLKLKQKEKIAEWMFQATNERRIYLWQREKEIYRSCFVFPPKKRS